MKTNKVDELFEAKLNQNNDLPNDIQWNTKLGWDQYQQQYVANKMTSRSIWTSVGAVAASILVLIFIYMKIVQSPGARIVIENNSDKPMEVLLACGNTVWLSRNSSVEYGKKVDKQLYEISVYGEAYFDLRELKSKEYLITVENAYIRVNDAAAFNIRGLMSEENIDVTVSSGAVKVGEQTYDEGLALLITEGNYCSVHKSHMLVFASSISNENYMTWKTGKFTFNDTPIETVISVLAEYYDTEIELSDPGLAYCMFDGSFDAENINIILNQIHDDFDVLIENAGNKITISGQGCI